MKTNQNPKPTKQNPQTNKQNPNQNTNQTTTKPPVFTSSEVRQRKFWEMSSHLHSWISVVLKLEARYPDFQTCLEGVLGWIEVTDLSHLNLDFLRASSLTVWAAEYCLFFSTTIYSFIHNNLPQVLTADEGKRPFVTEHCCGTVQWSHHWLGKPQAQFWQDLGVKLSGINVMWVSHLAL